MYVKNKSHSLYLCEISFSRPHCSLCRVHTYYLDPCYLLRDKSISSTLIFFSFFPSSYVIFSSIFCFTKVRQQSFGTKTVLNTFVWYFVLTVQIYDVKKLTILYFLLFNQNVMLDICNAVVLFCVHTVCIVGPCSCRPPGHRVNHWLKSFENKVVLLNLYCYCPLQGLWFSSIKFGGPKVQGASFGVDWCFFKDMICWITFFFSFLFF